MVKKGQLFLREYQLINVEGMKEKENHHLINTIVKTAAYETHQWIVKLLGKRIRNRTFV